MEQCLAFETQNILEDISTNMVPQILYTKESTHTAFQEHHRFILHHQITYSSQIQNTSLQNIAGKLFLIDEMGYQTPCSYIPIIILSSDNGSFKTSCTDKEGNYNFTYQIDSTATALLNKIRYSSNHTLFAYLPSIRIDFPFDTIIDDWDNTLIETPYLIN
ncbi:hypothetical protein [Anaerosporobacter sp.]